MARALFAAAAASLAGAAVPTTTVFQAYQTGQPECYRQPILVPVTTKPGALLAFAEGRNDIFHAAASDPQWCSGTNWPASIDFPIVVKASTDYGATWGAATTIMHGNLDFLTAAFDERTGAVHLMVQLGDDGVVYSRSTDGGASWTPAVNVTIPGPYVSIIPGVGRGLVVDGARCGPSDPKCGGAAGRILMPWACTVNGTVSNDTACNLCRSCLVASDDGGASWRLAAVADALVGSRESALAQLDSADWGADAGAVIYANARNLGPSPGTRMHAVSLDGGDSFAWFGLDSVLPDVDTGNWTGVVSGLARVRTPRSGRHTLVFTAPSDTAAHARANLTAYVSAGITPSGVAAWAPSRLGSLWPADAAYSDAVQINDTHVGVLFECGTGGDFAAQIAFAALPIDEL